MKNCNVGQAPQAKWETLVWLPLKSRETCCAVDARVTTVQSTLEGLRVSLHPATYDANHQVNHEGRPVCLSVSEQK